MAGEALLGAAFGMLIDRLASPKLINFFRGRKHDERLLKKLKLKLLGLNKVLNDAENKQINDRAVKEWLDELKGAVYDAEDLVDEIATEALRCKVEAEYQSGPNQVQSLISSFTKLFDNEIESKLERMIEILEGFTEEKDVLGLKEVAGRNWSQTRLEDGKPHNIAEKVRHFSYVQHIVHGFEDFKGIREAMCLRTFLPLNHRGIGEKWLSKKVVDEILPRLTRLRLLSLGSCMIKELPHSIGDMIHLRFLDLSFSLFRELPKSVCTLYNLETFLLVGCYHLTTLPADLVKLISLRHFDLSGTNLKEMPMNISRLKDLRELTVFVVGKFAGINELGELNCLQGSISISELQNVKSSNDALEAKMSEKKHLDKLALEWYGTTEDSQNARDVLEKLEPHTNLKHLEIKNYGGTRFPTWLGDQSFCNMASLRLENCNNCFSLPPLGQLPSLKELTIASMPGIMNVGHEFYGDSGCLSKPFQSLETLRFENCFFLPPLGQMPSLKDLTIESMPGITSLGREFYGEGGSLSKPFQSLETLRFAEMSGWVDWCILDAGEFSQLKKLELIQCPKLIGHLPTKLPSLVGLKIQDCAELVASLPNTTSLRRLELYGCQGMQLQWQGVSSIEYLSISDFASLEEFPSELVTLTNLKSLIVGNCPRLYVPLSDEMSHRNMFLEWLDLYGCDSLKSIPLGLFPKLRSLQITGCTNFETLILEGCKNMSSLSVQRCEKLKALPEQMHTLLPSLTGIYLGGESEDVLESFPEEGLLPSTLTDLGIKGMRNLKSLNGRGLQPLGSLERMEIHNCPQLQSFSVEGLPTSLLELEIRGCPLLKPRCRRKEGEDWPKISHIPLILVDGEPISE
ncbi:hypothetical protein RHGRI_019624 [Rhododendron griersonianum]|uniref:Rx N-terminal domain-containing protein n=1 Tax=Rhododendron griersonianum TaxID=479676 RepID=A0AAV6JIL6_9ERIC|nr:hypothetical protein RHGRI_019624 [Rhododendron griersonianum]